MPANRYWIVEQVRQVKILANNPTVATTLASRAFDGETVKSGPGAAVLSTPTVIKLTAEEER